jgi:hypothetical protein
VDANVGARWYTPGTWWCGGDRDGDKTETDARERERERERKSE